MDNDRSAIIEVAVETPEWNSSVTEIETFSQRIVERTLKSSDATPTGAIEVSVVLSDDEKVAELNKRYRGKATATNVLSFPGYDPNEPAAGVVLLGDVVLAYQTVAREAKAQDKTFEAHTAHLLVHGTLHLLGFDHLDENEADTMERIETRIMTTLGYPDPYAHFGEAV